MARRRQRRKGDKQRRHASQPVAVPSANDLRTTERVERLAYTRKQAAEALGVSLATLDRRVVPAIESVRTEWGSRLIPIAELERYLAERRQEARRAQPSAGRPGRKPGLSPEVVSRVLRDYANGESLGEIARKLDAEGIPTAQGGPSVVAVDGTCRSRKLKSAELRPSTLERYELADGRLAGTCFETHDEPDLERMRESLQRRHARSVLTRLDSGNGRVTRAHPHGELPLREPELCPPHDHEPGDPLVRRQSVTRGPVFDFAASPARGFRLRHEGNLPILISVASV
jgi:hypothetical protein